MDSATIKLHRSIVRHLKGVLAAYDEWIDEEELTATTLQLKHRRQEATLDKSRVRE